MFDFFLLEIKPITLSGKQASIERIADAAVFAPTIDHYIIQSNIKRRLVRG